MKKIILNIFSIFLLLPVSADQIEIRSPDNNLVVSLALVNGSLYYNVTNKEKTILENSPLGMITNVSDFSRDLQFVEINTQTINKTYTEPKIKKSTVTYHANEVTATYRTIREEKINLIFRVSNNDIAFKYALSQNGETARCIIEKELTGFNFPSFTTTFLTPQATPMIGWMRTKPSYEEEYVADEPVGTPSKYGVGYTFPGLFHVGDNGWALVSETGVGSLYCGAKLSEGTPEGLYTIAFPEEGENNGVDSAKPGISFVCDRFYAECTHLMG